MARVLLTHSYFLRFDPKEYRGMMPYAPLGTLYAAAYLRDRGHDCALFDTMFAPDERGIASAIRRHRPDVVVIYDDDFNYLTKMCLGRMRQAAFAMTRIARASGVPVVVHGSDPADHAAEYLREGAAAVVAGEGEITLGEYLDALGAGRAPADVAGIVSAAPEGAVIRAPRRPVVADLDTLPEPARDLAAVEEYRRRWKRRHGYFSMNLVTTRGCPFHCNWCAKPIYGQVYHSRSPRLVVGEILRIRALYRPDHLWFCDDIFGLSPGWTEAFADEIERTSAAIPFKCLSRADLLLRDDAVRHLARAGCATVWLGAESGSQKILDAMEKGTTVEEIRTAARLLRRSGIRVGFFLQYGYPGETRSDIALTLALVRELMPDDIGISVSYPLPGTPFHERVRRDLGAKQNWTDSEDLALMFRGTFPPAYYRVLHRVTHTKFRLWQMRRLLAGGGGLPSPRRLAAAAWQAATLPGLEARLRFHARGAERGAAAGPASAARG